MNVGIIGAGSIAGILSETMSKMKSVNLYAVASRSEERAKKFAKQYGAQKYYSDYKDLLQNPNVDLVYIATPHSLHAEQTKMCIEYGKPVLCEKAFTINQKQAKDVLSLAENKKVFVAEAIWTRYMPSRQIINQIIDSGIIGTVKVLTANLSYTMTKKERLLKPELAGGALLDVGVYALNFVSMHFGNKISRMESSVKMSDLGVDQMESITIFYEDGKMAVLNAGMLCRSDRKGIFYGEDGYIIVENINNPQEIKVYDLQDKLIKRIKVPKQISGYEYELLECEKCLEQNKLESSFMLHSEIIFIMSQMDDLRKQWGMVYPNED